MPSVVVSSVEVNGNKEEIEYQDPAFRGIITYKLPQGENNVELKFEDTKVRQAGKMISLTSIGAFFMLLLVRRKISIK